MHLGVLGPLEVDGRPASLSPRDRVVLEALALDPGRMRSADVLADALWGPEPPSTWGKVVQGAIVRLRRTLGRDSIASVGGGYQLEVPDGALDANRFDDRIRSARQAFTTGDHARAFASFDDALALWRGRPYPDLATWSPGVDAAVRLEELRQSIEEERVDAGLRCGRASEVLVQARRLVFEEPVREQRWALLATSLYALGRQADALSVLRRARDVLREELGLDPGPALADLEAAILRQDPHLPLQVQASLVSSTCPYPGLLAFGEDDADLFVGREADVAACLARLQEGGILVVAGPSGCGKSSLARAGLVPALRAAGTSTVLVTPGPDAVRVLTAACSTAEPGTALIVDQLEELTAASEEAQDVTAALAVITEWAASAPVVLVVRTEHLDNLARNPALARAAERGLHLLGPLGEDDLRRAIEVPAERSGLRCEHGLVDLVLRDVTAEPGALPLMAHALRQTWERRDGSLLTVAGYGASGGIRGAVAQSAEAVYASLDEQHRFALRGLLLRLVVPSRAGAPVGARLPRRVVAERQDVVSVLDRLVAARLVTTDRDSVTLAHACLAVTWERLRHWLADEASGQQFLAHLQVVAEGWAASGRPDSDLYRGDRLARTLEWRDRARPVLGPDEVEFLERSTDVEREVRAQVDEELRSRASRRRLVVAAAAVAAMVLATGVVWANDRAAESARTEANRPPVVAPREPWLLLSHRDATARTNVFVMRPDGSDEHPLMAERVMSDADVQSASWSPDGTRVAFEVLEGPQQPSSVWLVDADGSNPQQLQACDGPPCLQYSSPVWSADGTRLAMLRYDTYPDGLCCSNHLVVRDMTTGEVSLLYEDGDTPGPQGWPQLYHLTWSPDGRWIAFTLEHYAKPAPYPFKHTVVAVVPSSGFTVSPRVLTDPAMQAFGPDWGGRDDLIVMSTYDPDRIAVTAGSDLWTIRPDGTGLTRLTDSAEAGGARYVLPSWAPDGSILLSVGLVSESGGIVTLSPARLAASGGSPELISDGARGVDVLARPLADG